MPPLTLEQKKIVACDLQPGETLKIMAFAGTGKTTTLAAYAKARTHLRFLYLAFNKSVQLQAEKKLPGNVVSRTAHALAYRSHGYLHKKRMVAGFRANAVLEALELERLEDARFTIETLNNYLASSAPKVGPAHIPYQAKQFYEQCQALAPDLITLANRLGRMMCDGTDERIGMPHDGYLKLYQLSNPYLDYDCILLDEAQDINPVISAIVLNQTRPAYSSKAPSIILVGDSHQQIYSFRGARDTLSRIKTAKTHYLTQSFRFNNTIARVANMVLRTFKQEKKRLAGTDTGRPKPKWNPKKYTVIARTNATVFDKAVQLCDRHSIGFVGGIGGYRLTTLKEIHHLFAEKRHRITDTYLKRFAGYGALKAYAEAVEDIEVLSLCKVVEKYSDRVPALVDHLYDRATDTDRAEVLLTTAHKAKGLEWDNVLLMPDFIKLADNNGIINTEDADPDEFNLVYVAITRAVFNLRFDKQSSIPLFIQHMRKRA